MIFVTYVYNKKEYIYIYIYIYIYSELPLIQRKYFGCACLVESSPSISRSSNISLSLFLHLTFASHLSHLPINATSFDNHKPVYKSPLEILCFRSKREDRGQCPGEVRCVNYSNFSTFDDGNTISAKLIVLLLICHRQKLTD